MAFDFTTEPGKKINLNSYQITKEVLISIITPFYNPGELFLQTYQCVKNQTFPWYEWIIVDDGSTDEESIHLLKELEQKDSKIRVYRIENGGVSKARNYAVQQCHTEILVPLDTDDLIEATYLELLYFGLYFEKEAAWAYTDSIGFGSQQYLWKKPFDIEAIKHTNFLVNSAAIRKKDFLEAGGYQKESSYCHEDWILWLQLLKRGKFPVHIAEYGFWYRRSDQGKMASVEKNSNLEEKKKAEQIYSELSEQIDAQIRAKEYPYASKTNEYERPEKILFSGKKIAGGNKQKILMILPWLEMGGADLWNLNIVKHIEKQKYDISIVTTVLSENTWDSRFREYCDEIYHLPNFLEVKHYLSFISYLIESRKIQIIFLSNSYYGYYILPWIKRNYADIKLVDYVHMEEAYWRNGGYARISGVMQGMLMKTYVCNERTRRVMIQQFNCHKDKVKTLYIGVDAKQFDPEKIEKGKIQKELGIQKETKCILFPCRIQEQKRPFLMFEIVKKLLENNYPIAVIVVGDGPDLENLKAKAKTEGIQHAFYFTGRKEDLRPYYRDADLTLICSIKEGLALTAYESCAMGTPVVTSDVGGQRELIDEQNGKLVPLMQREEDIYQTSYSEEEIQAYVDAIMELLTDKTLYEKKCRICRERIQNQFSNEIAIKRLEEEFENLRKETDMAFKEQNKKQGGWEERLAEELITLYCENEALENLYKKTYSVDTKNELWRIANSKLGQKLVKLAFKLRLNRLFH